MVIPITNREVLAVHAHVEGSKPRAGVRVGRVLEVGESVFPVRHSTVWIDVGKVVCPNPFKMVRIFGERYLALWNGELSELFSDLFGFVSRYR